MRAIDAVDRILDEAANLDTGLVGVEVEFLVRDDLGASFSSDELYSNRISKVARSFGFSLTPDMSVKPIAGTGAYESLYQNCEMSSQPMRWSQLAPRLKAFLAWLKHEDLVAVTRGETASIVGIDDVDRFAARRKMSRKEYLASKGYTLQKFPRARVPVNGSAGVHAHFDTKTWFSDENHAKDFIRVWNSWRRDVTKLTPASRYGNPDKGGSFHASVEDPTPEPTPLELRTYSQTWKLGGLSGGEKAQQFMGLAELPDRYRALNTLPVLTRGDIEFRFIHGTLNFETIAGWMRTLAELIEYSKAPSKHSDFKSYLGKESPEADKFVDKSRERHLKSRDPMKLNPVQSPRSAKKLFKTPDVRKRKPKVVPSQNARTEPVEEPAMA